MTSPRVTVGLPVFNGEQYLAETIESILAQDFEDFELLVADNASTDRTRTIVEQFAARDSRIRLLPSETNRGAAWNYNRLVDEARGEYFKWAAHDDRLEAPFISRCVEVLDDRPEVVLCYTEALDIDDAGAVVRRHRLRTYATGSNVRSRVRQVLLDPSPCLESFGVVRTAELRRTGRIGAYTSSDRTLFLELCLIGQFYEVGEPLFHHRQHPGRSVFTYSDPRQRNLWFDPRWQGRRSLPKWRLFAEYLRALSRADMAFRDRIGTGMTLTRWLIVHRRQLSREIISLPLGRARVDGASRSLREVET